MSSNLFIGSNCIRLERVDSTNNYARQLIRDKTPIEGTVIVTNEQLAGRGQRSNSWVSMPNLNLTCSYILKPVFLAAKNQFMLSAAIALAVHEVVFELIPTKQIRVKWPNDILVNGKKIAGILIENSLRGSNIDSSIVGIGLNVNQSQFSKDLNATSLKLESDKEFVLEEILELLNHRIEKFYLQLRLSKYEALNSELNRVLFAKDELLAIRLNGEDQRVRIVGVEPSGELQIQHSDGKITSHQHHEIDWKLKC